MGRLTGHSIIRGIVWLAVPVVWLSNAQAEPVLPKSAIERDFSEEEPPPPHDAEAQPGPKSAAESSGNVPTKDLTTSPVSGPLVQAEQEAREAFRRGDRLYLEGDYEGAVSAFEEAYAKSGKIEMLFNLANAHERLANYAEAALLLRGYIPHSPESHRPVLERRLERLKRLEVKKAAASMPPAPSAPSLEEASISWPRLVGVGLTTLGGAALLTGFGFALSAARTRNELDDVCAERQNGRLCPPEANSLLDRDKAHSIVADAALLGGAVLATTGIVFIITASKPKHQRELVATPGLGSVWLRGTF